MTLRRFGFVFLAATTLSVSAQASIDIACTGENESETLQFAIDGPEGIQIDAVTEALTGGTASIEIGDDEAVYLGMNEPKAGAKTIRFDTWEGNWGFALEIPYAVFHDGPKAGEAFEARYRFDYNDIAEFKLERTLNCREIE